MDNETIPLDSSSSSAEDPLYILSLLNNELMSFSWKLINKEYNIGRSSESNIILDDITVFNTNKHINTNKATVPNFPFLETFILDPVIKTYIEPIRTKNSLINTA